MMKDFIVGIIVGSILTIVACALFEMLSWKLSCDKPEAIDVYRGKTTLKITYVDSIPQDTTVIFKN